MPNPITPEALRNQFLDHVRSLVDYWNGPLSPDTKCDQRSRLDGLAFSILAVLDGDSLDLPAFDLVARPHPDDKEYLESQGEDWAEDGTVISDVKLHEMYYRNRGETET